MARRGVSVVLGARSPSEVRLERSRAAAEGVVRLQASGVDADEALSTKYNKKGDPGEGEFVEVEQQRVCVRLVCSAGSRTVHILNRTLPI